MNTIALRRHQPWNKGKLVGRKPRSESEISGPFGSGFSLLIRQYADG